MLQSLKVSIRFVTVECFLRNPCWFLDMRLCECKNCIRSDAIIVSSTSQYEQVSKIGLYLDGSDGDPFLNIGVSIDVFHSRGSS